MHQEIWSGTQFRASFDWLTTIPIASNHDPYGHYYGNHQSKDTNDDQSNMPD